MVAQVDKFLFCKRPAKAFGRLVAYAFIEGRPLTTKGRWINSLVFFGYKVAQIVPSLTKHKAPIYIVGTGRSGTTVLGKIFSIHRETVFLNEPKALWHFAHGAEDVIGSYSDGPAKFRLIVDSHHDSLARVISNVYNWAVFWGGATRVVDKYPELIFRTDFTFKLFPDARFIAIVRDGVDTCSSVNNWSKRKGLTEGGEAHDWWGRDERKWKMIVSQLVPECEDLAPLGDVLREASDHRDRAAVEWMISMREAKAAINRHPDGILTVRYEDLCAYPERELQKVLNHCELCSDTVFMEYAKSILSEAESYRSLELLPSLVEPFKAALVSTGYSKSVGRVIPRKESVDV